MRDSKIPLKIDVCEPEFVSYQPLKHAAIPSRLLVHLALSHKLIPLIQPIIIVLPRQLVHIPLNVGTTRYLDPGTYPGTSRGT